MYGNNNNLTKILNNTTNNDLKPPLYDNELIVCNLDLAITADYLLSLFGSVSAVIGCKLMIDQATRSSLGYGFIKYSTKEECQKAIDLLDGRIINEKAIKVTFSMESGEKTETVNLYIQNLPPSFQENDLRSLFEAFGPVYSLRLLTDNHLMSKCTGMVKFRHKVCADAAINVLNYKQILPGTDKFLIVKYARQNSKVTEKTRNPQYSQLTPIVYTQNSHPQNSYPPPPPSTNPHSYHRFNPMGQSVRPPVSHYCVYVSNLQPGSDNLHLYQLFSRYGAIAYVNSLPGNGANGCIGFVNFVKYEEACSAINALNKSTTGSAVGKTLNVSFKNDRRTIK